MTRFLVVLAAAGVFTSSALAAPQTVSIFDTGYIPETVTVDRGDIVTWVNNGADLHTVTSDEGTTMESGQMQRGGVFATQFDEPGRYPYHDDLNPDLRGVVVVRGTAAATPTSTEPPPPAGTQPPGFEPSPATTEVTPAEAAGDESDSGGGRDVWVNVLAVLAVAAAAAAIFFWIVRRRGADDSEG